MCGILGLVYSGTTGISPDLLSKTVHNLYKLSETRGKEASGVSYIENGTIKVIKQNTSASALLRSKAFKENLNSYIREVALKNCSPENSLTQNKVPITLIGHSRLVTNGDSSLHYNNQPVIASGLVAVHNGIIVNDAELWQKYPNLERHYQVDTEIMLNLIRHFLKEGHALISAAQLAFGEIKGATSIAAQFEDLNCILLATNNGSLYLAQSESMILFASEEFIIKSTLEKYPELNRKSDNFKICQIEPGNGLVVDLNTLNSTRFVLDRNKHASLSANSSQSYSFTTQPRQTNRKIVDLLGSQESSSQIRATNSSVSSINVSRISVPKEFDAVFEVRQDKIKNLKRCTKCVLPNTMPFITFDDKGVCSYCNNYQLIKLKGKDALLRELHPYINSNAKYNCIVSLSGGRDSSYGLHYIKNILGMRPITYTYDWGMVTDLARRNISRICGQLGIEHILISADIRRKRSNIRKNVSAWLKQPKLGMIPLFMAGDKQFFYHGDRLKKQLGIDLTVISENLLERTSFKTGFCGINPVIKSANTYTLPFANKIKLISYYLGNYFKNPGYLNLSLIDTFLAYCSYYVMNHNFLFLYQFIDWNEAEIENLLLNHYEWELAPDTKSTWRIGDGTTPFYNYIYYMVAGFTENDTFRSNQIREGHINREEAIRRITTENRPRWESIKWYCDTIQIDFESSVRTINKIDTLYQL